MLRVLAKRTVNIAHDMDGLIRDRINECPVQRKA